MDGGIPPRDSAQETGMKRLSLLFFLVGCGEYVCPNNLEFGDDDLCYPGEGDADADSDSDADADADSDSDIDTSDADIEIAGVWIMVGDALGGETVSINDEVWLQVGSIRGEEMRLQWDINRFSNAETWFTGTLAEMSGDQHGILLGTWTRVDWMWVDDDLVYCVTAEELETEDEALDLDDPTPREFPGASLCNEDPWTVLTPAE
jgi:hypothetical protein